MSFSPEEMSQLKAHLERTFKCSGITVMKREKAEDSIEVMVDGEFIGVLYKIIDEGETSFDFNMAILDIDLV
ncbi:MAG: hypothetical protein COA45_00120 [Zetaproteobacteria bacterium]|nr:MAG: hypothetical protein COA45_00120 [Zetaproteobacteria bacterium]